MTGLPPRADSRPISSRSTSMSPSSTPVARARARSTSSSARSQASSPVSAAPGPCAKTPAKIRSEREEDSLALSLDPDVEAPAVAAVGLRDERGTALLRNGDRHVGLVEVDARHDAVQHPTPEHRDVHERHVVARPQRADLP